MSITRETWTQCRTDYITGKGSLAGVAARHGLKTGSVEKCAKREGWTKLRRAFEAAQLAKLIPPTPPSLPLVPVAPDGSVSDQWMQTRMEIYYRRNTELLDKARKLLDTKLSEGGNLGADELARLTTALGGMVTAESQLLGLRDRRGKRKPARASVRMPEPLPEPGPEPGPEPASEPGPARDARSEAGQSGYSDRW